jgi:hypothetical protein
MHSCAEYLRWRLFLLTLTANENYSYHKTKEAKLMLTPGLEKILWLNRLSDRIRI